MEEKTKKEKFGFKPKTSLAALLSLFFLISCTPIKYKGLISWEDYYAKTRNGPYVLELNTNKGSLVYFGVFHSIDAKDPQFLEIEEKWENFRPTVAYCEGSIWPLEKSKREAISKHGEQGLLRYLAARDKVSIRCIEPTREKEALYLFNQFPPEQVKVYYVLRQAVVNRMLQKDSRDLEYVNHILRNLSKLKYYRCYPTNLEEFKSLVAQMFPELKNWQNIPASYFKNYDPENFLSLIHRAVNDYRDQNMLATLIRELKSGKRVFAVVGRSHVVRQEPVLRVELTIM
jgi:hypothetical protein